MGPFDFALAGMAVQMQAPRNLFARGQEAVAESAVTRYSEARTL
jgi:hypothetical protein